MITLTVIGILIYILSFYMAIRDRFKSGNYIHLILAVYFAILSAVGTLVIIGMIIYSIFKYLP